MKVVNKELVFDPNHVPFSFCHASNICVLSNGELLVSWFGGSKEGEDDTAIWMARYANGKWNVPAKIADDAMEPHWNPVLFQPKSGPLMLFYKVGKIISNWYTKIRYSDDEGRTWSRPKELVAGERGGRGPVRNKIVPLSDGSIVAGGSIEQGIWHSFVDRSIDGGKTWKKSNRVMIEGIKYGGEKTTTNSDIQVSEQSFYGRGVIQPTIWESNAGHVHMLLRSTEGLIYRSDSTNSGQNWGRAYPTILPNNNSGIDVIRLVNGKLVLCYNPVGENWGVRTPLSLAISNDDGGTWEKVIDLEDREGEYSYPSITADDNYIYVSYTDKRKNIVVSQLKLTD